MRRATKRAKRELVRHTAKLTFSNVIHNANIVCCPVCMFFYRLFSQLVVLVTSAQTPTIKAKQKKLIFFVFLGDVIMRRVLAHLVWYSVHSIHYSLYNIHSYTCILHIYVHWQLNNIQLQFRFSGAITFHTQAHIDSNSHAIVALTHTTAQQDEIAF